MAMRLIDADKLKRILYNIANTMQDNGYSSYAGALGEAANIVDTQPTIDAVPVVHGRWSDEDTERYVCAVCGKWFFIDSGDGDMNYCPNCGAKMDGGKNDDA